MIRRLSNCRRSLALMSTPTGTSGVLPEEACGMWMMWFHGRVLFHLRKTHQRLIHERSHATARLRGLLMIMMVLTSACWSYSCDLKQQHSLKNRFEKVRKSLTRDMNPAATYSASLPCCINDGTHWLQPDEFHKLSEFRRPKLLLCRDINDVVHTPNQRVAFFGRRTLHAVPVLLNGDQCQSSTPPTAFNTRALRQSLILVLVELLYYAVLLV